MLTNSKSCNCESCAGATCKCGCQDAKANRQAASCLCGEKCECTPECRCQVS